MYIGNIHWKHCRLETLTAFGIKKVHWKHTFDIANIPISYWKHNMDIGNIRIRLETYSAYWKHHFRLETYIYWKHITKHH